MPLFWIRSVDSRIYFSVVFVSRKNVALVACHHILLRHHYVFSLLNRFTTVDLLINVRAMKYYYSSSSSLNAWIFNRYWSVAKPFLRA